jgi:hypothetical protein
MPRLPENSTSPQPASLASIATSAADGPPAGRGVLAWDGPWMGASLTAMCLLGVSSIALASPAIVLPAGVTEYRLAFITDETPSGETVATSTVIGTYNAFAASQALTNANLPKTTWDAIVSTATKSAVNNVSCGAACNANVPIFLVDGTEVAASTNDLFGGSSTIMNLIDRDAKGSPSGTGAYVWTGSNSNGTAASGFELGSSTPVTGWDYDTGNMLSVGFDYADSSTLPIYAISGELSAHANVPEPTSLSLLAFGGAAMGLLQKFRRRRRAAVAHRLAAQPNNPQRQPDNA